MADQTLTFTLDTGDGEERNVVIKLRPTWRRTTSSRSPTWLRKASMTAWSSTA